MNKLKDLGVKLTSNQSYTANFSGDSFWKLIGQTSVLCRSDVLETRYFRPFG